MLVIISITTKRKLINFLCSYVMNIAQYGSQMLRTQLPLWIWWESRKSCSNSLFEISKLYQQHSDGEFGRQYRNSVCQKISAALCVWFPQHRNFQTKIAPSVFSKSPSPHCLPETELPSTSTDGMLEMTMKCLILFAKINVQKSEIWMTKQVIPGAILLKSIDAEFGF